jgi:hypothetical protein
MAVNDVAELQQRVEDWRKLIRNMPEIFKHVWQSLMRCTVHCMEELGEHFKQLL